MEKAPRSSLGETALNAVQDQSPSEILDGQTSLEDKLRAIDEMVARKQAESDAQRASRGLPPVPIDPADATICDGCT